MNLNAIGDEIKEGTKILEYLHEFLRLYQGDPQLVEAGVERNPSPMHAKRRRGGDARMGTSRRRESEKRESEKGVKKLPVVPQSCASW